MPVKPVSIRLPEQVSFNSFIDAIRNIKKMKQYPIPTPMATDETLIGLYARTAPSVPDWFEEITGHENASPYELLEDRFFQWRLYYAKKMIELLTQANGQTNI